MNLKFEILLILDDGVIRDWSPALIASGDSLVVVCKAKIFLNVWTFSELLLQIAVDFNALIIVIFNSYVLLSKIDLFEIELVDDIFLLLEG